MLTTPRLLLRPQEARDAEVFHQLWSERDPRVPAHRRLDVQGRPSADDIALNIKESGTSSLLLSVVLRESATLIGYAGLVFNGKGAEEEPEIAFELLHSRQLNGYATEAGAAVLGWARELGHRRVWASVWDWNVASRRVLEKLGFRDSGAQQPIAEHGRMILTVREL